jgi:hypothetical protein
MSTAITAAPIGLLTTSTSSSSLFNTTSGANNATTADAPDLSGITDEIADIIDQIKLSESGLVQEFQKNTNDVKIDNNMTARDIGALKKNTSRLNLFSALSQGDSVDVFRFRINTTGATKLGTLIADPVDKAQFRIQIFEKGSNRLLVDNDSSAGDAYARFTVMSEGKLEMKQGEYIMRMSRKGNVDPQSKNEIQYAVQLTQGVYTQDFDTVEQGYSTDQDQYGFASSLGVGTDALIQGLSSSYSFISNLAPIGTSATSKLSGALYDALF